MTETQLAKELSLTKAGVGYHLHPLLESGLITLERTEVEEHGILQKFYSPTATLFIASYEHTSPKAMRYFMRIHMERLRGFLSAFLVLKCLPKGQLTLSSDVLEELAKEIARRVTEVSQRYEAIKTDLDRETLLIEIYAEALEDLMGDIRWKSFFKKLKREKIRSRSNVSFST